MLGGEKQVKQEIKLNYKKSVSLVKKHEIDFSTRFPITEEILETLRLFAIDEAIQDPNEIKNILITGGGSLL